MMLPRFAATMCRSTTWLAKKTPLALTASSRSQSASVTSAVCIDLWMPALFTRMSMRPNSATVRSAIACRSASRVTSVRTARARRPRARTSSAVRLPVASSISATTMSAPIPASSSAMARPMLRPAPVTIAACPPSSISAAPARDAGPPLDQLDAHVVRSLDEADARAAGDLDRSLQEPGPEAFQARDVRLEAVGVEAEVFETVVRLRVARAELLVGAGARDGYRGAVLALAADEPVAEHACLVGDDLEREGLHVPLGGPARIGGLEMDVIDPVGHGGVLSAEVSSVPRRNRGGAIGAAR